MCMYVCVRACVLWLNSKLGKVWQSYNVYELFLCHFYPLYLSMYIYIFIFIYLYLYIYSGNLRERDH